MLAPRRPLSQSLCTLSLLLLPAACRTSEPVEPQPLAAAEPEPTEQRSPSDDASHDETPTAEAPQEPEAAPEPEPEPEPLVAPDGTVIKPCGEVPPGMACIPGGPFIRGTDDPKKKNAQPAETVWLQTFYMDLYEVTYADYKACQASKECRRGGPLYNDFSRPTQPIVGPNWYAAVRYCEVQGKHLPTEAQWEKAARGPDGARYPWGDEEATCDLAVIKDERGRSCGVLKKREHPKKGRTFVVGSRAPGVYGLYDMAGNAWEWVYDWASPSYAACGDACRGTDPKGPCDGAGKCRGHEQRVVKGGSWYWDSTYATGYHRRTHFPINEMQNFHHFGFRCAASLEEGNAVIDAAASDADSDPVDPAPTKTEPQPEPQPEP